MSDEPYTPSTEQVLEFATQKGGDIGWISVPAFYRWLATVQAKAWDERDKARQLYLGPDHGHYEDCLGWEDCYCGVYRNPYLPKETDS